MPHVALLQNLRILKSSRFSSISPLYKERRALSPALMISSVFYLEFINTSACLAKKLSLLNLATALFFPIPNVTTKYSISKEMIATDCTPKVVSCCCSIPASLSLFTFTVGVWLKTDMLHMPCMNQDVCIICNDNYTFLLCTSHSCLNHRRSASPPCMVNNQLSPLYCLSY